MSLKIRRSAANRQRLCARIFAALGDERRLLLVSRLRGAHQQSIAQLTQGSTLTRQAVTKHLRVLEDAGIVHSIRSGRQNLFQFDPEPIGEIRSYLELVSEQWDQTLARLQSFVEK
jgi:DNA-binding transcriptional ArsR family regulator